MPFLVNLGKYSKFIAALLTAASVGVTTFAGTAPWAPTVLAILGAISVYAVPNTTPDTPVAPPATPSAGE